MTVNQLVVGSTPTPGEIDKTRIAKGKMKKKSCVFGIQGQKYEKALKIHKKALTNLEINVPVAIKESFYPHIVCSRKARIPSLFFCKYNNIDKIRRDFNDLVENFERELGDLIQIEDPDCVYLVVFRLLNPGLKPSDKYRFIGFVEVFDDIIQVVWLHPFLRNRRLITDFFVWYGTNENILLLQPPIMPNCMKACENAQKIIRENFEYSVKNLALCRKYLKKKNPEARIDELLDSDLYQVVQGVSLASKMQKDNDKKDVSTADAIRVTTDLLIYFRNHPEARESIENELKAKLGVPPDRVL